jgi:type VI secretion system protein ImpL
MNQQLMKYLPYILGGVGVLIAGLAAGIILLVKSSRKGPSAMMAAAMKQKGTLTKQFDQYKQSAADKAGATAEQAQAQAQAAADTATISKPGIWTRIKNFLGIFPGNLGRSFKQAIRILRQRIPGRDFRYRVPWFLMMGESGSGKTTLLNNVGLPQPFGMIGGDPFVLRKGLTWWMFTNGIVLDVDGGMVASPGGRSSDEGTWQRFLTLLRRNRPERPLDGVIIAIPSDDLIGPAKLSGEDLRRKADLLYEKIWSAQKATGMTFPVYIFVTKCDRISGFRSFVSELPKQLQDDMFGWSNPYSVHNAYVPEWVDQAAASLNNTIYKTQIEIFAESETVEDSDGVFLFPSEFATMIDPLRVYLNHLFKESAHHESFMFRGVYFCGDALLDAPATTEIGGAYAATAGTVTPTPVFLKHVFEKKIFPENSLARPVFRSVLARNRWALAGQVACILFVLLGSLALWWSSHSLQRESIAFHNLLVEIERDLAQIREIENSAGAELSSAEVLRRLEGADPTRVLMEMQAISAGHLRSVLLPASWPSTLDEDLDRSLNIAFSKMVLGSIYLNLNGQIQAANAMTPPETPVDEAYYVVSASALPEFQTLRRYIERMDELEEYTELYNFEAMPDSGDLETLGKLVKYVYGSELPPSFYQNSDFYLRALKASQQEIISIEKLKADAAVRLEELGRQYFEALHERTIPIAQLEILQGQLRVLSEAPTTANSSPESYRVLMTGIDELGQTFARPELAWLGKPTFDPGPEFKQILEVVEMSKTFGAAGRMKLEDLATAYLSEIKSSIEGYQSSLTGPILQVTDNIYKPAPSLLALRQGLEDFLNQRFMAAASNRRMRTALPPGSIFNWDPAGLQQALQLVEPYNAFLAGGLASFRPELQARLRVMALNRLESNMVSIVSSAQHLDSTTTLGSLEIDVQNETKLLKDVAKPLSDLLTAFDRLGMTNAYTDLSEASLTTAFMHLRAVDQLFQQKAPFAFDQASLDSWEGAQPLLTAAFGSRDEKGLPEYLEAQRENLKMLVEHANPAITIIAGQRSARRSAADTQLLTKWQSIAAEMDKYANKNPASAVATLETFVGTVMPTLTVDNYFEKIAAGDVNAQSSDFFLNRRNDLRRRIYRRFDAIAAARALRQYQELAASFNQNLAGKFPFVAGASRGAEADPPAIREFFKLFDANNKSIVAHLDRLLPSKGPDELRVAEFLKGMVPVRAVLASFLDDPKAIAPIFDFEVEFRVNQRREVGGNQIIEWQLEVGDQKILSRDTMKRGRWVLGDPVILSLRWAKDGPNVPVNGNVDGSTKTVAFREATRWSLLSMLQAYASAPADFDQLVDPAPTTLRFLIPQRTASGDEAPQTRVFVRLTLLSADKKEPVTLPVFPVRAPALDRI